MTRLAVVPGAPVLLPRYASLSDPVADLRTACHDAVRWLVGGATGPVTVVCLPAGEEVACHLLPDAAAVLTVAATTALAGLADLSGRDLLVVADGSARRGERAPGHLDDRAQAYDAEVTAALRTGRLGALRELDLPLGRELLAGGAPVLRALARSVEGSGTSEVGYAGDPFGVQYWVLTWTSDAR